MKNKVLNTSEETHTILMKFKQDMKLKSIEEALDVFLNDSEKFRSYKRLLEDIKIKMEEIRL